MTIPITIDGETKYLGIIGQGISYSLSPAIHNFSATKLGINQIYLTFDLPESALEPFISSFWDLGGIGLNITKPYKTKVAKILKVGHAEKESINTLFRKPGLKNWQGASTDGPGFRHAVERLGESITNYQNVVILGSGGAAQAIYHHLQNIKDFDFHVCARAPKDSAGIFALKDINYISWEPTKLTKLVTGLNGLTLVVQASSAPLNGDDLNQFCPVIDNLQGAFVDIVYGKTSALCQYAKDQGTPYQDGLPMLIEQARLSQEHWWGKSCEYDEISKMLQQMSTRPIDSLGKSDS